MGLVGERSSVILGLINEHEKTVPGRHCAMQDKMADKQIMVSIVLLHVCMLSSALGDTAWFNTRQSH